MPLLPAEKDIQLAILEVIADEGGEVPIKTVLEKAAKRLELTPTQLQAKYKGKWPSWKHRAWGIISTLRKHGDLEHPSRGVWEITEKGKERLRGEGLQEERARGVEASKAVREEIAGFPVRAEEVEKPHERLKTQIQQIGKILGKYAETERHEKPYIYDVVWKEYEGQTRATHVFEVQDKGNLIEALAKLQHAHDIWGSELFLVVTGERDRQRLNQLLVPLFSGTFHRITKLTTVLNPDEVDELHKSLSRFREVVERFLAR